jgi:glucose-6-phosphate-specific signal transduction histidine kinase
VIAVLFVAVFVLRIVEGNPVEVYSMFYVLPVALAATAFGQRGGLTAAALAGALVVSWALVRDVSLSPVGWVTRLAPILLLGLLLGRATDRARRAEHDRRRLERTALLHRQAIEINDTLVQRMAAAKWSLEAGQTEAGVQALTTAVHEAQQLVSELIRRADMADHAEQFGGAGDTPTLATVTSEDRRPAQ